jgi:cell wall-associated NlpC family hydrolase
MDEPPTTPEEAPGTRLAEDGRPDAGKLAGEGAGSPFGGLSDDLKAHIRLHAQEAMPNEACGLVVDAGDRVAVRCPNSSAFPASHFRIHPRDREAAERLGQVVACYHSHVYRPAKVSDEDKTSSEACRLPFVVVGWPTDVWALYTPCGWRAQLEGRPFCHGVLDCYSLVRDYYRERLGIEVPDFYRDDLWWERGEELILDNMEAAGFAEVADLRPHDVLLMQLPSQKVVCHAAVYLGDGHMLHHVPGRLSGVTVYTANAGYWARSTRKIARHRSLISA